MEAGPDDRVPVLSTLGDALERAVYSGWYRWFVRLLVAIVVVLGAVHLVRLVSEDALGLSATSLGVLELATGLALGLFVLAGAVQLLVFARGIHRREAIVAASAEDVERSADDVTEAAEELEKAVEDPERIETAPEEIESTVERAEAQATGAKETAEKVKGELDPPTDGAGDDGGGADGSGAGDASDDGSGAGEEGDEGAGEEDDDGESTRDA